MRSRSRAIARSAAATLPVGYLSTLQEPVALLGAIYIAQALGPAVARFALLLLTAVLVPAGFLTPEVPTIEVAGFAAFVAITLAAVRTIGHWRLYPAQAANTGS